MLAPVIDQVKCRRVDVPLDPPLESASGEAREMPIVLLDLQDRDGGVGHGYLLCYATPAADPAAAYAAALRPALVGGPAAPRSAADRLSRRLRLLGRSGVAAWVAGGVDMALWDLAARRFGQPLAQVLGAAPTALPAYASLRSAQPKTIAEEAGLAASDGFKAFKVKIGHGSVERDLEAVAAVRSGAGDEATVMVDYNQSLTVPEAIRRAEYLSHAGVAWIEEPVDAGDMRGHARVTASTSVPVQLGENWQGPRAVAEAVAVAASDLAMLDAMNVGGVMGWLAAAALADAAGMPVSSHLFCEISPHLLAATPGRHWVEWLDVTRPLRWDPPPRRTEPLRRRPRQARGSSGTKRRSFVMPCDGEAGHRSDPPMRRAQSVVVRQAAAHGWKTVRETRIGAVTAEPHCFGGSLADDLVRTEVSPSSTGRGRAPNTLGR